MKTAKIIVSEREINLSASIIKIGKHAFNGCISFVEFSIPFSIDSIEEYCFANCSSLEHVNIPSSIKSIGSHSFYKCSSIIEVSFEKNSLLNLIDEFAFCRCTSLCKIVFLLY